MRLKIPLLILLIPFVFSCASTINRKTSENYYNAAVSAIKENDWMSARMYFSRAWGNAKMGNADLRTISMLRYEYGRASGVVCEWDEAEAALNEAYELDIQSNGPYWMPLVELERMSVAKQDFHKAIEYFDKLMPVLKDIQGETKDPLGYADILEEYALALQKTGENTKSQRHLLRAKQLRDTFPGRSAHTEITPYGRQCKK